MSDQPKQPDVLRTATGLRAGDAAARAIGNTGIFMARDRAVRFAAAVPEPDESHRQLMLEALEQMFIAGADALFLDPASDAYRLSLRVNGVVTELGVLPAQVGRVMVETIRREASLRVAIDDNMLGKFCEGLLRVEYAKAERRMHVHLFPTAQGIAAALRLVPTLPAAGGDLQALGLSPEQAGLVEAALGRSGGMVLVGGVDAERITATCAALLARGAALGRRAAALAAAPGADSAGVTRIEAGRDENAQAGALLLAAQGGMNCIGVEQPRGAAVARAAAQAAAQHDALVLLPVLCRSAWDAVAALRDLELPAALLGAASLSLFQIHLPLLCRGCARWGEIAREDLKFFDISVANKPNFYVRGSCQQCNGQVLEYANVFEVMPLSDAARHDLRSGAALAEAQAKAQAEPYVPLHQVIAAAAKEGRFALNEARQYLLWQIPQARAGR